MVIATTERLLALSPGTLAQKTLKSFLRTDPGSTRTVRPVFTPGRPLPAARPAFQMSAYADNHRMSAYADIPMELDPNAQYPDQDDARSR
jgi:hypothetical protein